MLTSGNGATSETERSDTGTLVSPFEAGAFGSERQADIATFFESAGTALESPFAEAMATTDESAYETFALEAMVADLEDERFDEAIQALVDEVAARHLASAASWSSESEAPALASEEVEASLSSLRSAADHLFERLEQQFSGRPLDTLNPTEFQAGAERLIAEAGPLSFASEQFLGGLVQKAKGMIKGAVTLAKKGMAAVGKILPLGKIFDALRKLVRPLLARVLQMALNRLPPAVRPHAQKLAATLFAARESEAPQTSAVTVAEITEAFDTRLAESLLAPTEAAMSEIVAETEAEVKAERYPHDPIADLDTARTRLVRQLQAATPGVSPVAEVQQFIPVVMAALPLIRMGVSAIGRDKVVRFVADRLAELIKGHIGPEGARALARPIADVGLRMLSLESGAVSAGQSSELGAEAVVSALEDTVRTISELPAEAFVDPLRLEAETQEAFVEAVSRYVPRSLLSRSLQPVETTEDRGVWIYMPRATRPCYRYRKFSHIFRVPISRPVARAVHLSAGDTLERRLLDAGARVWPVQAEIHMYETLPGTQLGHLAAYEAGPVAEAGIAAAEFEELTPEVASMLVNEPGLGVQRRPGAPVRRLLRIVAPGLRLRRFRRFVCRLDVSVASPVLRIHLHMTEREAHEIATALSRRAHARVIADLRSILGPVFRAALARRLARHLAGMAAAAARVPRPMALADKLADSMLSVVSAKLPESAGALAEAARDAARGLTLTFEYGFADRAALMTADPDRPKLVIRAGWHYD